MMSAAFASKSGSLLAIVALQSMRLQSCLRQDAMDARFAHAHLGSQLTYRPVGTAVLWCCCTFWYILACTAGFAIRGLLPLCCASKPATPNSSNRCFHRA